LRTRHGKAHENNGLTFSGCSATSSVNHNLTWLTKIHVIEVEAPIQSRPLPKEPAPISVSPIPQTPDRGWGRHFYSDLRRVRSLKLYSLLADGHYFVHPNTKISKAPEPRLAARVTLASPPPEVAADNVPRPRLEYCAINPIWLARLGRRFGSTPLL
jgi:hypothetical protein